VAQVIESGYNLDVKNPSSQEALVHRPPGELIDSIAAKEQRIAEIIAVLKATLRKTNV
jgi:type I restriction enzyme M protein